MSNQNQKLHSNEGLKEASNYLRGTILEGLADVSTGAISANDQQLTKFHGMYLQDDRDVRNQRRKQKLDKAYSFMVRVGLPGGICTPEQWLAIDELVEYTSYHTIKLSTRQAFQLHGVIKSNLKSTIQTINEAMMTTLAACGDDNRNVLANPNPHQSQIHREMQAVVDEVSAHLKPKTGAYSEIWLNGEPVVSHSSEQEEEPLYGRTYLPRKFKIAFAVPPVNDVDVFTNCLGFIAIVEDGKLAGFNISVGGGMGMTHGKTATFPRLGDVMAFCTVDQVLDVAEKIVTVQRDFGDRVDRAHARFKYTVDDRGVDWIRAETEKRLGYSLGDARDFEFTSMGDRYGWVEGADGKYHLTLYFESGRVVDDARGPLRTGMREIAKIHRGDLRLTANQNLIIAQVAPEDRHLIDRLVEKYQLDSYRKLSGLRLNQVSCVALPTCGLALAESERYLPSLLSELEVILEALGLAQEEIVIRSTGCPNGCARPYVAEIALVGRAPGKYNLYLGGSFSGQRMNKLYRSSLTHDEIVETLRPIFAHFAQERLEGEHFGDFTIRLGYVQASGNGADFHENVKEAASVR
jgi:sulfite reductase (NADPH) hemoprotein beta-component